MIVYELIQGRDEIGKRTRKLRGDDLGVMRTAKLQVCKIRRFVVPVWMKWCMCLIHDEWELCRGIIELRVSHQYCLQCHDCYISCVYKSVHLAVVVSHLHLTTNQLIANHLTQTCLYPDFINTYSCTLVHIVHAKVRPFSIDGHAATRCMRKRNRTSSQFSVLDTTSTVSHF